MGNHEKSGAGGLRRFDRVKYGRGSLVQSMSSVTLNELFLGLYIGCVSAVSLKREPRNKVIYIKHT